jgi:hypothetical protein
MSSAASRPPEFPESTAHESVEQPSPVSPEAPARPKLMGPPKRPAKPAVPEPSPESTPPGTEPENLTTENAPPEPAPTQAPAQVSPGLASAEENPGAEAATEAATEAEAEVARPRQQPISPPSEPMQYRAIGLLRGRYVASEEMFNRGQIITQDDTAIGAVLLGRVTSLVKKHLDMESRHLWVVYPRTNPEQNNALNVQIVGVWEPETLGTNDETSDEVDSPALDGLEGETPDEGVEPSVAQDTEPVAGETVATEEPAPDISDAATQASKGAGVAPDPLPSSDEIESDYFSIRGEIAKYFEDRGEILVNILQKVKSGAKQQRPFKLLINGHLEGKTIGYFWDLHVVRQADQLVLKEGTQIAAVPPKKKSKRRGPGGGGGGPRKRFPSKGGPPRRVGGNHQGTSSGGGSYRNPRPTRETASETARVDKG